MTQHPSLKGSQIGAKFRAVLKRFEKIKELTEKEKWDEEKDSIYKLPKVRRIKFKVKKAKGPAEDEEGAAPAEGADAKTPAADGDAKAPTAGTDAKAKDAGKK